MSMKDLQDAFELIDQNADQAYFSGPKSEELVKQAEEALEITFPPSYREFLRRLGCGDIAGQEFYGIVNGNVENVSVPNGIWLTLTERKSTSLSRSPIIIGDTGDGGYYAIDRSVTTDGESPVVEWWAGPNAQIAVAQDFGEFFLRMISDALEE
ncbi:MAG: hypothetical protein CMJ46_13445 [Planctomyces sp.]|nr:hypothetical protein [Planctomyces sp.]